MISFCFGQLNDKRVCVCVCVFLLRALLEDKSGRDSRKLAQEFPEKCAEMCQIMSSSPQVMTH